VRPITVDATQGEIAVVSQGLSPGEQVVVDGQAQIKPHARVSPGRRRARRGASERRSKAAP